MFNGSFGSMMAFADTLQRATPYIFGGLAFAMAAKAGLFNIGMEGQMYIGAMLAAIVGFILHGWPIYIHLPLAIIAGMVGGMIWSFVPGLLKIKSGAHEVITTVMLNYVAFAVTGYLTVHLFLEPGAVAQTPKVSTSAMLPIFMAQTKLNLGFIIAIICAIGLYILLYRTPLGYNIRVNGLNSIAARFAGINSNKIMLLTLLASGALSGLMGAERILGVYQRFMQSFSPGYGFTAIAVALLGRNHPLGIIPAAIIFGALENGGESMALMVDVPREFGPILQALIIVVIASTQFVGKKFSFKRRVSNHG
jgi:simple sugar transport system permease protein